MENEIEKRAILPFPFHTAFPAKAVLHGCPNMPDNVAKRFSPVFSHLAGENVFSLAARTGPYFIDINNKTN